MKKKNPQAEKEPRRERVVTSVSVEIRAGLFYTLVSLGVCFHAVLWFSSESQCHASQIDLEHATLAKDDVGLFPPFASGMLG